MSAQLPLALRYPPDQRFDSFVGAPAGALAQLCSLARGDSGTRGIYLAGHPGTGKTHLAIAACAQAEADGRSTAYLPLGPAAGRLRSALESLEARDLVAIDDLDAVAGDGDAELALFDFHNRLADAGGRVLYTACVAPQALSLLLPDLGSRLAQCARIALSPLDDAGRAEVLRLRAQRRGLQIDPAAIEWLLKRADRDLGGLTTLLDQLDRASLAAQRRVTVPFLRQLRGGDG